MKKYLAISKLKKENEVIYLKLNTDEEVKEYTSIEDIKEHVLNTAMKVYTEMNGESIGKLLFEIICNEVEIMDKKMNGEEYDGLLIKNMELGRIYDDYHIRCGAF